MYSQHLNGWNVCVFSTAMTDKAGVWITYALVYTNQRVLSVHMLLLHTTSMDSNSANAIRKTFEQTSKRDKFNIKLYSPFPDQHFSNSRKNKLATQYVTNWGFICVTGDSVQFWL